MINNDSINENLLLLIFTKIDIIIDVIIYYYY